MNKNFEEIVQKTATLLKKFGGKSIDDGTTENNFWGILCKELNSIYNLNEAKRLKQSFARNSKGYKSLVEKRLSENENENTTSFKISYSKADWQDIVHNNISTDRKFLKQKFAEVLSYKLQDEFGLFCCFRFRYNYFSREHKKPKSQNLQRKIWTGELECLGGEDCNAKAQINAFDMDTVVELNISAKRDSIEKHKAKIMKKIRTTGSDRENQSILLSANGITNTRAENILFNSAKGLNPGINLN